ncbi:MAG TPA: FkbM family methyltransferase [Chitinophagaceae bacterium]|nr:FkbM family methyltransferase [Chitinophagaceae bacterium]
MSSLYFLGVKRSAIKKIPPFKYLFDWRDRKNYQQIFNTLSDKIEEVNSKEATVNYSLNERNLRLLFRKFPFSDLSVLHQVFVMKCYEPVISKMLSYYENTANLKIIDAGANVGYSSIYFKTYFPLADVIAIEPEEKNLEQLEKNIERNRFNLKELIKGALWPQPAFLEVTRDFRDNREAAFTVRETKIDIGIPGFSFDQIIKKSNWDEVDFIKIDIEGAERFLFDSAEKADTILKKIKFLAIEIHDEFHSREMIYQHLTRNNFEFFEFGDLTFGINMNKTGVAK